MGARHERGHFLVPHLHEVEFVLVALESGDKTVNAVTWIAENPPHTPLVEPIPEEIAHRFRHGSAPYSDGRSTRARPVRFIAET